ncbi:hypothetical protein NA78x_005700 [Anatilimnocola sp. NA78]|uniref:hypothetical protein n=1 Tax=Anatilimnocola sp. NA78 TaxID=3415683 RepID=UPI003CE499E6
MQAALLLIAVLLGAENDPAKQEALEPFTLEQIAAGAKNDAFVDEYLKDQTLQIFGTVKLIERMPSEDKKEPGYRVIFERTGHEERALDVMVGLYFDAKARKDLALIQPGVSKVTVQGRCSSTEMQSQDKGLLFILEMKDSKLVETPDNLSGAAPPPQSGPRIIPNPTLTPPFEPGTVPPGIRLPTPPPPPAPRRDP